MASSSSTSTNVGNMVMVTHVLPAAPTGEQQPLLERGRRFRRGQPKALGTVQIMIGVVVLVFSVAIFILQPSLGLYSGIFVWGALLYIASGSVTVAAEKHVSVCLINASLVLNIIAAVVAAIGTILYAIGGAVWYRPYSYHYYYTGFSIVLAVFQFLQLIVSVIVAGYSCSATCGCCVEQPQAIVQTGNSALAAQAPPHFHAASAPPQPHPQEGTYYNRPLLGFDEPPAYKPAS